MKIEKIQYELCDNCGDVNADLILIKKWFCRIKICRYCLVSINKKSNE